MCNIIILFKKESQFLIHILTILTKQGLPQNRMHQDQKPKTKLLYLFNTNTCIIYYKLS